MFEYEVKCKCGTKEITGWHPFWGTKNICEKCRKKIVNRHRKWIDKLLLKAQIKAHKLFNGNRFA